MNTNLRILLGCGWIIGCTGAVQGTDWIPGTGADNNGAESDAGQGSSSGGSSGSSATDDGGVLANSGLPCDVQKIVASQCASCHGATPTGGAPNSLVTLAQFRSASSVAGKTEGQLSVDRMKNSAKPMPPSGLPPAADVTIFENWVKAGMQAGSCGAVDAGAGSTNYNTPTVCTSNVKWTRGNQGSSSMHPGTACISCHSRGEGPRYSVAGTLYPTAHEPDDCYGKSGATIVVTDANNRSTTLTANGAGNFGSGQSFAFPIRVKVVSGTKVRAMAATVSNGDCNTCHTEKGTQSAPGRIMLP